MYYTELQELANQIENLKTLTISMLVVLIINLIVTTGVLILHSSKEDKKNKEKDKEG